MSRSCHVADDQLRAFAAADRAEPLAATMAEVDELIWSGDLAAALELVERAVKQLGEFKEGRAARYHLTAALTGQSPPRSTRG